MPQSAAATETALDAQGTSAVAGRQVVHVELVFENVNWSPGAFYDTLNAAYGTVSNLDDTVAERGPYRFLISA